MTHRPRRTAAMVCALVLALTSAACSGEDEAVDDTLTTTSSDGGDTTESTDTTETTAAASTTTTSGPTGDQPCARSSEGDDGSTVTSPGGGEATIGAEAIFADLPPEVPLPEDSILDTTSSAAADPEQQVWIIRCTTTTDDPEASWNTYKSALDGTGCTIVDQTMQTAGGTFIAAGECELSDLTIRAGLTSAVGSGAPGGEYRWDIAVHRTT